MHKSVWHKALDPFVSPTGVSVTNISSWKLLKNILPVYRPFSQLNFFLFSCFQILEVSFLISNWNCALLIGAPWFRLWLINLQAPLLESLIHVFTPGVKNQIIMKLQSDSFNFCVGLICSLGSLYAVTYDGGPDAPAIVAWWREIVVLTLALYSIVWKHRKPIKKTKRKIKKQFKKRVMKRGKYYVNKWMVSD